MQLVIPCGGVLVAIHSVNFSEVFISDYGAYSTCLGMTDGFHAIFVTVRF